MTVKGTYASVGIAISTFADETSMGSNTAYTIKLLGHEL
jgi:hypothetical protein